MKYLSIIGIVVLFFLFKAGLKVSSQTLFSDDQQEDSQNSDLPLARVVSSLPPTTEDAPVLADTMLARYATDDSSGREDLQLMARFLDSVFLLVKTRDTADYATNEDLALFLLGANSHQSPFLNKSARALNPKGQIIDRWDSPIVVHPVSSKLLEIRSAGPDRVPYTADDLTWPPAH